MSKEKTELEKVVSHDEKIDELNKQVDEVAPGCKVVHYDYFHQTVSDILGKVLTIIDASIVDQRQNKSVKDLVKQTAWKELRDVQEWFQKDSKSGSTFKPLILDSEDIHP